MAEGPAPQFDALLSEARSWLLAPREEAVKDLFEQGKKLRWQVPRARAKDWDTLLAGFVKPEPAERRRLRVEGLARACELFSVPPPPLAWDSKLRELSGVGPKTTAALSELGVAAAGELVWLLPVAWQDLREPPSLADVAARPREELEGARVTFSAEVKSSGIIGLRGRKTVRVSLVDGEAKASLFWFFLAHGVLAITQPGARVIVSGRARVSERGKGALSLAHAEIWKDDLAARTLHPKYLTPGVKSATMRVAIKGALARLPELPDPVPPSIAADSSMPDRAAVTRSLFKLHGASDEAPELSDVRATRERLGWVEAFARAWQRLSANHGRARAPKLPLAKAALKKLEKELGFEWTEGQAKALAEIREDLRKDVPMRRLLLGDVGTGKTAVALAAVAQCVSAGKQAAILAPTGVLAEQYASAIAPLVRATGIRAELAVGSMQNAHKSRLAAEVASGDVSLLVGTHALLSASWRFDDLALVIVDEQQRLGVAQRLSLVQKGKRPHLLSLTATPIPRTLMLSLLGDIQTSVIDERPKGRLPVTTEVMPRANASDVIARIRAAIDRDERVFVIAPRVLASEDEEDGDADDALPHAATLLATKLEKALGDDVVALVHGKMKWDDKRETMARFRTGERKVLVGTTVLEVGVDVPEATLMVVVGAEHFGLSQLHQLRGRVGRGARPSTCVLLHDEELTPEGHMRLAALVRHDRGSDIARVDLELRGAGDLSGTDQSGDFSDFVFLDPREEPPWLSRVAIDAARIHGEDPKLAKGEHAALALMMGRFEKILALREEAG